ncbi:cell division protein ZapA [Carnobacteriaceae bacterium zg-C25]|nr:cell division protein ZapA [Carnobacteriaceae bacterium zg-ZUI240]QTU82813.1 cell division protein ZapA [Carnobacteriaceae bacterium zg-C25]
MSEKKRMKVSVDGKAYTVISTETAQHIRTVEEIVNEQFRQLKQEMKNVTNEDVAILLALNTVSQQIQLTQEVMNLRKQLNNRFQDSHTLKGQNTSVFAKNSTRRSVHAQQMSFDDFVSSKETIS